MLFIDPDDDSAGEPDLWVACDQDTVAVVFYQQHSDWVEYTSLLDEVQEPVSDERE